MLGATGDGPPRFQSESTFSGLPCAIGELAIHADFQMHVAMGGLTSGPIRGGIERHMFHLRMVRTPLQNGGFTHGPPAQNSLGVVGPPGKAGTHKDHKRDQAGL
jgi:hypothetical protein